tara:strand:- start:208 stop:843 length:636 start_codon:yes stop_codon:yes gene_type:complete
MEEEQSTDKIESNDPWVKKTPKKIIDDQEKTDGEIINNINNTELDSLDESALRTAMVDWKKKGNILMAEACAEALRLNQSNQDSQLEPVDDLNTVRLKAEINRMEAEAVISKTENNKDSKINQINEFSSSDQDLKKQEEKKEKIKKIELKPKININIKERKSKNIPRHFITNRIYLPKRISFSDTKFVFSLFFMFLVIEVIRLASIILRSF